ncbi:helix-turn-helix transcriptional regulator [Arthrobacter sp.]|uniref:helix-turn-helix transcriptional regulator n=1 Tax=Arthrobacter sp. TaxID=1667 RepID=UPI003A901D09
MSAKRNPGAPSRTEKLVSLTYALMSRRRGYTRAELRGIVDDYQGLTDDAFERKFERDKEDLRGLGVPLETLTGDAYYGNDRQDAHYRIRPEAYRLPAVSLAPDEALALGLAARVWKDPTIASAADRAFGRLLPAAADAPEDAGASFETFEPRLHAADAVFRDLLGAVWDHSPIRFTYRPPSGQAAVRTIEPWGLGNRFGHWYLVGWDRDRDGQRIFRLSRITSEIARRPGTVERPEGFRIADVLDALDPESARQRATVRLAPGRGLALRSRAVEDPGTSQDPDTISFDFQDDEATSAELAELGPAIAVLAPDDLRAAVVRRLEGARYAMAAPAPGFAFGPARAGGRPSSSDVVARALDIIAYVVREGAPLIDDTAAHFGLSRRRLIDDLAMIQMCGVPNGLPDELIDVDFEGDRVTIANAEGLSAPIRLNLIEAFSLLVGLQTILDLPGGAERGAARGALAKLREAAGEFGDIDQVVSARLAATEASGTREAVTAATASQQVLHLAYHHPGRDDISERDVEPIRLVEDGGRTYLQAWCRRAGDRRNFRLDRILTASTTGERFTRDPARHAVQDGTLYTPAPEDTRVVLGFAPRLQRLADEFAPRQSAKAKDGTIVAEVGIAETGQLPGLVARHGGELRVIEPPEAVEAVRRWLHAALDADRERQPHPLTEENA